MKNFLKTLFLGFIFCSVVIFTHLSHAQEGRSKAEWVEAMTTALPTAFCKPDSFFRQCFKVSAEQCEETALSAVRVCFKKHEGEIPDKIDRELGGKWGTTIGGCAGNTYEITLSEKKASDAKCEDPKHWIK